MNYLISLYEPQHTNQEPRTRLVKKKDRFGSAPFIEQNGQRKLKRILNIKYIQRYDETQFPNLQVDLNAGKGANAPERVAVAKASNRVNINES
jgi:hypothetical protein